MLRFAPTPTGDISIADLRVALFNYIVSKQKKEDFIVRIEDIDKDKTLEGKDKEILEILALFNINYSQVIYQSENIRFHTAMALQLMHEKKAFSCFCSDEWIAKKRDEAKEKGVDYMYDDACANLPAELVIDNTNPFCIRIKKPTDDITIKDYIKGEVRFKAPQSDSFVIMDQNKRPTPDFASGVDDMLSDISIIIRDEDKIDNTLKQEHIRASLKYEKNIEYIHIPSILDIDERFSVKQLLADGFLPETISNYLISTLIDTPKEIFSLDEAIEWFSLDDISSSPTRFDINTLRDLNKQYLINLDSKELSRYVGFADEEIGLLAKVYPKDVSTTKELRSKIEPIFSEKKIPEKFKDESTMIINIIKDAPYFDKYDDFKNHIEEKTQLKDEKLSKVISFILTGSENSSEISEIYNYIKNYIGEIVK
jgi:glutamyl-tRNA synthetase